LIERTNEINETMSRWINKRTH